jgi:hypothetical protein
MKLAIPNLMGKLITSGTNQPHRRGGKLFPRRTSPSKLLERGTVEHQAGA